MKIPSDEGGPGEGTPAQTSFIEGVLERLGGHKGSRKRYHVKGEIARGGMGVILRVWDEDLRRDLAMKIAVDRANARGAAAGTAADTAKGTPGPRGSPAQDAAGAPSDSTKNTVADKNSVAAKNTVGRTGVSSQVLGRFFEEAQVTGQLEHPGIVPVHEIGLDDEGRVFFTMRLVAGRDLEKIFALVRERKEDWTQTRAVGVILKICEAMAYAHEKGVIHRDLKPANVMVGKFGEVYVMDWGLARVLGRTDRPERHLRKERDPPSGPVRTDRQEARQSTLESPLLTMAGDILGTPAYMSPEQGRGEVESMGPASDIYSTGSVLYHLLAGHMPYAPPGDRADAIAIWERLRDGPPEPVHSRATDAPLELCAICEKAMARDPGARYASMQELAQDLRAYLEGRVVHAYETGAVAEFRKWVARNRALALTSMVAITVILLGTTTAALVLRGKNVALAELNRITKASEARALSSEQLAQHNAAVAEERAERILRLSDVKRLQELEASSADLWPAHPETIGRYEAWLEDSRALAARLQEHVTTLETIRSNALPAGEGSAAEVDQRVWTFGSTELQWQHEVQEELVEKLEAFVDPDRGRAADVQRRLEFARTVEERSISGDLARAQWVDAALSIANQGECPAYGGLVIVPQIGLLPIGRDPRSGFWEFAHLQTGEEPARDPGTGELNVTEGSGLVFVLLPGGSFLMGAQNDDPVAPNYDPEPSARSSPVRRVELDPFFLAKHEMTQGQWQRFTGANPSMYGPDRVFGDIAHSLSHPVEQVSWTECSEVLERMQLELPTEAQWEYAARSGTTTAWWTGQAKTSLDGAANLADRAAGRVEANWPAIADWPELDDGFPVHAPVDRFTPSPWGLFNTHGNVWEWCRDELALYDETDARAGDGLRSAPLSPYRVNRGGSYSHSAGHARSAYRNNSAPEDRRNTLGVRPARAIKGS